MEGMADIGDNGEVIPENKDAENEDMESGDNDSRSVEVDSKGATSSNSSTNPDNPVLRVKILSRVAMSDAHFKHQQIGEPDLTLDEKIIIAQELLDSDKVKFLSRFSNYLELEDVEYFSSSRSVYEVDFYCKQIVKNKSGNFKKNVVKNRRYEAMKELMMQGDYFSDDEMKFRDPYLYDQMVGQYLTDDEIRAKVDKSDLTFSSILIKHMDIIDENKRFQEDKDMEEGQEEEEEDEEESGDDEDLEIQDTKHSAAGDLQDEEEDNQKPKISEERRQELKDEFLTLMQERFMNGEDRQFDYSKVDSNENYDNLTTINYDAEERYFDDEDPESIHSDSNL